VKWYVISGVLVVVSIATGVWRIHAVRTAPEAIKRLCAREPIGLDPKQYSNCVIRHT
jgi:hypothetical protein